MPNPLVVRSLGAVLIAGCAAVLAAGPAVAQQAENRNQQRVLISVVDKKGTPVTTLSAADLTIREDGREREVLKVEPATGPMTIAILADTSTAASRAIPDLRTALKAFGAVIWAGSPDTQMALYSFGDRPALEGDFSPSAVALNNHVDRLFAAPGSGSYFIDAVVEAASALRQRKAERAVIVAYVDENGPEFSNRHRDHAYDAIAAARASLWTVTRQGGIDEGMPTQENRERSMVVGDVTTRTGGRSATVVGTQGIKAQFETIAAHLLSQLEVTYGRAETLIPPDKLEIKLANSDLRVAAPRWTTR